MDVFRATDPPLADIIQLSGIEGQVVDLLVVRNKFISIFIKKETIFGYSLAGGNQKFRELIDVNKV